MNEPFTIQIDADAERRRALAKIYSLLIRLAEKSEEPKLLTSHVEGDKKGESAQTQLGMATKESNSEERSKQVIL